MHMRLIPKRHRLRMSVFTTLVDLDRLPEIAANNALLRHNGFGVFSIMDRDHGARDGSPLRPWVEKRLQQKGLPHPARIELLSFPRMFGYGFNPLSIYYCYDRDDRLKSLIYEVKNTFGGQVAYVLSAGEAAGGMYRQRQDKKMYVSPFIGPDQVYRFALNSPGEKLAVRIRQAGQEGETLIATLTGRAETLTTGALARALVAYPLMTVMVIVKIHWHAARLVLKGVPFLRERKGKAIVEVKPR
ncbi:DUF1365 family protein [Algicella marina]|uniref:DUF1365 family protein n=2 Tax=Algicella marina TaxID=2683284 RepID=A0A6P1T9P0_9RHOB|nr:DUF1365 family protein [Algicella marina]